MAELASGAVSSLLGVLRNEALLLSRVRSDVEFIKEEMESMHSFLEHLSRTAPPAGGHDEQVGTWMKQVQDLAHDCSNCVDLYLRLGDRAVFRARGGRYWRCLWWASWLVQRTVAQHKAAIRLRELKERARDVGKRRLRYGVEIPGKKEGSSSSSAKEAWSSVAAAEEEDEEDGEDEAIDQNQLPLSAADGSDDHLLEPRVLEEYFAEKLAKWLLQDKAKAKANATNKSSISSMAIVAPDDGVGDAGAIVRESLMNKTAGFENKVFVRLAEVHHSWDLPLQAPEILCYVLREYEPKPQMEAYWYKTQQLMEIWRGVFQEIDVWDKFEEIKTNIGRVDSKKLEETKGYNLMKSTRDKRSGLVVLLLALRLLQNENSDKSLPPSLEHIMEETAQRLRTHMGMEPGAERMEPGAASESEHKICLKLSQFKYVLGKAFPASKTPQPQSEGSK